jgi:hypothetical protein
MRNDVQPRDEAEMPPPSPLVILAADDDAACIDDLCLAAEAREDREAAE